MKTSETWKPSFENVDHGSKSMKGGSALLLPTGLLCEQGSLRRALALLVLLASSGPQ